MPSNVEIITIGDEILYGQTLDTNSHWMSGSLDEAGFQVVRKTSIADTRAAILQMLKEAETRADIILITGGLGPTNDDLTKPTLVEYFDTHLVHNKEVLEHIQHIFTKAGREMSELNIRQADLPANCIPMHNAFGTAPGMWFEAHGKVFVSMPGVPFEMKKMMTEQVLPRLVEKYADGVIHHKMIRTVGIPESKLANIIKDWEEALPEDIKLAYLPTMGMVKLRLTSKGPDKAILEEKVAEQVEKVLPLIDKYVYGYDTDELEVILGQMLKAKGKKLAIAESCTGGFLSHMITSVPGSSAWFNGSFVPYSNELKNEQLMVGDEILKTHGAVSEPVVIALAENVRKAFHADVAVSVSGIAGPGGGSEEKPVGTVWIGYADEQKSVARVFHFTKDRTINIKYSSIAALNMVRVNLNKE